MTQVDVIAQKVRSKNAGPFWVTIDVFCGNSAAFDQLRGALDTGAIAALYQQPVTALKRFDITDLNVIKFSFPRPVVQGNSKDRDMHGAAWATLLAEYQV
ncbi:protein of unknown function [Pseudorhodobacter antarcticus]|jgi:hypothetical protein|uniref:DUF4387 domain-containing protein n=1 Tax=Pseudorhodobacter antarcticus TaxID=1077947 RepID=A0A1H8H0K8_9RHOB|nr:DUF4387 family protein [Pseudorhodobacter antarcticus]SEN49267.1 protein of unknown function [Pseudorhodobacter antarcticus]